MAVGIEKKELEYMGSKTNRIKITTGEESGFWPPSQSYGEFKEVWE